MTVAGLRNSCRRLMSGSPQQLLPVGRHTSGRSRRRLIQWVMFRWGEFRAVVVELLVAVIVEPMLRRLVTGEHRMSGRFGVDGGVLARRVIATADVSALSTPARMNHHPRCCSHSTQPGPLGGTVVSRPAQ